MAAMFSTRGAFVISFLLVALCYVNSLPNDFVFDDGPIVSSNPVIRTISPIQFLKSPYWTKQQYAGIYRPFVVFSLSVDYAIWKRWAPGFRLTNLAVHAINGVLVFSLYQSIAGAGIVPLIAMIIYLVHPVHTEAVTTIVGRSELFAACFLLAAWLLFRQGRTGWAALAFFLALLSKENAIVLPAILLLDSFFSRARGSRVSDPLPPSLDASRAALPLTEGETASETSGGGRFRTLWAKSVRLLLLVLVALVYLAVRYSVLGGLGIPVSAQYMGGRLTYFERLLTSGRVFIQYLILIFYPLNLAGDYDYNAIPIANFVDWDAWLGLLLIAATVVTAYFYRHRNWAVSLGLSFALIAFIPASNWIMPISILMAERFLYLPFIGLALVGATAMSQLEDRRLRRLVGIGALCMAIVLCNSHDYIRRDDFTFFKNMVRVVPNSAKARLGWGFALTKAGRNDEAERELEAGLRIIPDYPELLSVLALARTTSTSCVRAWPLLSRAIQIDPKHADTERRMADCYLKEGRVSEAESMYRQAAQSIPNPDAMLYFMWGVSLENSGQSTDAIAAYERAALIEPENRFFHQKIDALRKTISRQDYR
jgi:tetratricopeptide (TPR) repeat protein